MFVRKQMYRPIKNAIEWLALLLHIFDVPVQILAWISAIETYVFHGLSQSTPENAGIIPQIRLGPFTYTFIVLSFYAA
jgi:hypothetical protein